MQNYIKIAIILVALLTAGAGYWYISIYQPQKNLAEFQAKYDKAHALHHAGRLDESIEAFSKLSEESPTIPTEVQTKLKLAYDLFARNKEDDRSQSIEIYKKIIMDPAIPSHQRAIAISDLMDLYNGTHDDTFARNVIFRGEPFSQYLQEAKELGYRQDLDYAMRRAYEFAETFYPLSLAEFRIAGWYFGALDSGLAAKEQEKELLNQLESWTMKGETNLSNTLRLGYEPTKVAYMHMTNALARRKLASHGKGDYAIAEQAFEKALSIADNQDEVHAFFFKKYLNFHYAAALAEIYGNTKIDKIKSLLAHIVDPVPLQYAHYRGSFEEFLRNEVSSDHDAHGHKKDLVILGKIVPEFKSYLTANGIRY